MSSTKGPLRLFNLDLFTALKPSKPIAPPSSSTSIPSSSSVQFHVGPNFVPPSSSITHNNTQNNLDQEVKEDGIRKTTITYAQPPTSNDPRFLSRYRPWVEVKIHPATNWKSDDWSKPVYFKCCNCPSEQFQCRLSMILKEPIESFDPLTKKLKYHWQAVYKEFCSRSCRDYYTLHRQHRWNISEVMTLNSLYDRLVYGCTDAVGSMPSVSSLECFATGNKVGMSMTEFKSKLKYAPRNPDPSIHSWTHVPLYCLTELITLPPPVFITSAASTAPSSNHPIPSLLPPPPRIPPSNGSNSLDTHYSTTNDICSASTNSLIKEEFMDTSTLLTPIPPPATAPSLPPSPLLH